MNEIIEEFQAVKLTKTQRILPIIAVIMIILANANPTIPAYALYRYGNSVQEIPVTTKDLYFGTLFYDNGAVTLGVFNNFVRLK